MPKATNPAIGGWVVVLRKPLMKAVELGLNRSGALAQQLIGENFFGILICYLCGACNLLMLEHLHSCSTHILHGIYMYDREIFAIIGVS